LNSKFPLVIYWPSFSFASLGSQLASCSWGRWIQEPRLFIKSSYPNTVASWRQRNRQRRWASDAWLPGWLDVRCPAGEALDAAGVEALDSTGGEALDAAGGELDAAGGDAAGGELDAARRSGCWNLGFFLIRHIRRRCLRRRHRQRRWARERLLVLLTASP